MTSSGQGRGLARAAARWSVAAALLGFATSAFAAVADTPPCPGTDLVGRMRDDDPDTYAKFLEAGRRMPNAEGLLWRVEADGKPVSHLFGTIHLSDPRLSPLAAPVTQALSGARIVLVEPKDVAAPDPAAAAAADRAAAMRRAVRPTGKSLAAVPYEHLRPVVTLLAARGVLEQTAQRLQPWFLSMLASIPPCEVARGQAGRLNVDQEVVEAARRNGAGVEGLESADEQMEALASIDPDLAIRMLVDTAVLRTEAGDFLETMVNLYRDRRMGYLAAAFHDFAVGGPRMETQLAYLEALLPGRNARMDERSRAQFDQGGVFMAVGALHLSGEDGLVERLRRRGFRVAKVW